MNSLAQCALAGSSGDHHLWTCMCALAGSPLVNNALLSLVSTTLKDLLQLRGIAAWFCSVYRTDRDTMTRVLHSARHIKPGIAEPDTILMKLQHRERKERFTVQGIIEWEIASKCITAHSQCTKFIWQTFWSDQVWPGNLWIQYRQSWSVSTSKPVSIDALSQGKQTSWTSLLKASLCNVVAVEKRTGGGFLSTPKISVKMQQFESNPGF